jgi:hypothetical protein
MLFLTSQSKIKDYMENHINILRETGQTCNWTMLSEFIYARLSLGGEGIFLLFRISNPMFHKQHFNALAHQYIRRSKKLK